MLESILLVAVLSLDAFMASMAYGMNKINIPLISISIINVICACFLSLSLFLGSALKRVIPEKLTLIISFTILLCLGIYYLFESIIKSYINVYLNPNKKIKLKLFDLSLIIYIYVDEIKADLDNSKHLNPKESFYLAVALSLDSLAVGFGSGLGGINPIRVVLLSLIFGIIAISMGLFVGRKLAERAKFNLSWLAGVVLIGLAILKFM
ncbi:MAG: sporulation membrane protein YtaF [Clostridiales bacterium]|nr:sporulation membrane protein YtaF [Clostridiales bacterium]